jgi:hypothetical protein
LTAEALLLLLPPPSAETLAPRHRAQEFHGEAAAAAAQTDKAQASSTFAHPLTS